MLSDISLFTNHIAITFSITVFIFTIYHWKVYKYLIAIPFWLCISSITYGIIDKDLNDILYDISYLTVIYYLIAGRLTIEKSKDCSHCSVDDCNKRIRKW